VRFTAMNRGQRGKLAMATAALGIGLLSVTGCGYINPQQTAEQYSASDGTRTDLGPLQLRNFIIISDGEDKPGRVIGAVYNTSSQDAVLTIKGAQGSQAEVPVKQHSYTMLNDTTEAKILVPAGAKPGGLAEVTISDDASSQDAKFAVPVLDGTIVDYKSYLPTPEPTASSTATSTATATSTESATATPTPSSTAGH
jgi:hypothetical protein